ncbi:protocadherin beta-15 [Aplysia californica]|uniref:Protocadherin beta-15 n=1 Tax=Aplysia californica TaxID=6500 RepID=A0ABM0K694_APLCA|nr:protocadherin beta-15 [Aplysia californica]
MAIQSSPEARVAFSNVVTVKVVIRDINDNTPTFPAGDVTLELSEGAKVGTELKISGAVDRDSRPEFTVQHYNSTPALPEFSIRPITNPDGSSSINLRLERELDREATPMYVFNIIAYDGGAEPRSDYLKVTIKVTDDNDNSPVFEPSQYELTINEDEKTGAVVGQVTATDKDIGENGRITYSFSPASESAFRGVFAINATSGVITLEGDLDTVRRLASPFSMFVDASDGGDSPRSSQTLVAVTVLDSGNNAPYVRVNTVTAGDASTLTIPESAGLNYFVAFVDVVDYDDGESGKVLCQLMSGEDFKLKPVPDKGYTLLLNRLVNREAKDSYRVSISCKDGGNPPLETAVSLTVNISDVNDNDPAFHQSLYAASVSENRPPGHFVAKVKADDEDTGINAEISYSLAKDAAPYMRIQARTGIITTTAVLDREKNETLRFKIYASDGGKGPRTGMAEIVITIKDVNDNNPSFNQTKFSFFVSESTPNSTHVGTLTAFDLDTGRNGEFDFYFGGSTNGDMPLPFIVLENGSILVSGLLDRETKADYSFSALVRDRGDNPRSGAVPVELKILDENDNDPVILFPTSQNHTVVISTYPENGMVLGRIIAYDVDEGDAALLQYSIYEGNEAGAFSIGHSSGELTLINMARLNNPENYFLSVKVADSSLPQRNATTQLRIEVNFANVTALPQDKPRDQYVIIVGVIGGATVVLSIIIISAIVIILRSEKGKRGGSPGVVIGNGGSGSLLKDNKFLNTSSSSPDTSKTSGSLDNSKSQSDPSLTGDHSGMPLNPGDSSGSYGGGGAGMVLNPNGLCKKAAAAEEGGGKKVSFSLDLQQDEYPGGGGQGHGPNHQQMRLQLPPPLEPSGGQWKKYNINGPDDINSDTSGESGTCDSGRGTSDEDIKFDHSPHRGPSRGPPPDPFLAPYEQMFPPGNATNIRALQAMHHATPRTQSPALPLKPGQPRFLEMGGAKSGGGGFEGGRSSYHGNRHTSSGNTPSPAFGSSSSSFRLPNQHRIAPASSHANHHPDVLRPPSSLSYTQQGSALSMDDDASTTTSGSYVINPEDMKLDGHYGKDVIV